uniref:Uncharacterized protein n=1 Tax=Suricata suricatta TaxID=37032 RepID=A0A673UHF8_SURSU
MPESASYTREASPDEIEITREQNKNKNKTAEQRIWCEFITKIWHPNISSVTGAICLDILKDQWAAAMTLRTVLLSLQALLAAAEPDDPQDEVVANQYKQNPEMFKQTARLWAHVYAGAPVSSPEYTKKIENLCAMGFDRNAVIVALSSKSWDVETATELLLSN